MSAPIVQVNGTSPEPESADEFDFSLNLDPEDKIEGIDYNNLGELLRCCSYPHYDQNRGMFWSHMLLKNIMTKERIMKELDRVHSKKTCFKNTDLGQLADNILMLADRRCYLKVFAVLALLDKTAKIPSFITEEVCDSDLPIVKCSTAQSWHSILARKESPHRSLGCFRESNGWKLDKREAFMKWQHLVDVVYLGLNGDKTIQHEKFEITAVFPWVRFRQLKEDGGYANVYRAVAPPDCHGFNEVLSSIVFDNCFAVKELKQKDVKRMKTEEIEFWKEVEMLKRFSGTFHDHLVTLLMTWTIQDRHYFLFPFARSDLDQYWTEDSNCPLDTKTDRIKPETMLWVSKQILGITEALSVIHNPSHLVENKFGRHGDLKAENILWYRSPMDEMGILVIADFGLGAFNSAKSRSGIPGEAIPATPTYRPPECDLEGGVISRSFDIWTYGCLLLEWACWAMGGQELRGEFERDRMTQYINGAITDIFFDVKLKGDTTEFVVTRKDKVTEWINKLHNHHGCTQYFHDLLDLIEDKMLIVLTPTQNRITCTELVEKIDWMNKQANNPGSSYATTPCPQKREQKRSVAFAARLNETARRNIKSHDGAGLSVHRGEVRASKSIKELQALAK